MKLLNLSFFALTSVLSMNPVFANTPSDLEDLMNRWHTVEKTDQSDTWIGMEPATLAENEDVFQRVKTELQDLGDKNKKISSFQFAKLKADVRDVLLRSLFPTGETDLAFCESFPAPKIKSTKEISEDEKAEKLAKMKFNNCRAKVKEILGGTLHSNPTVYAGDVSYEDGTAISLFYVGSLVEKTSFARYYFKQ